MSRLGNLLLLGIPFMISAFESKYTVSNSFCGGTAKHKPITRGQKRNRKRARQNPHILRSKKYNR